MRAHAPTWGLAVLMGALGHMIEQWLRIFRRHQTNYVLLTISEHDGALGVMSNMGERDVTELLRDIVKGVEQGQASAKHPRAA